MNFGPLAAEICWRVWGTPANFNVFRLLAALLHGTPVVGVSQTLRHSTEGAILYSAGRPSGWALAHISSSFFSSPILSRRRLDVYHTSTHGVALANLGYRSETCCRRLAENTGRKKSPKIRHLQAINQSIYRPTVQNNNNGRQ